VFTALNIFPGKEIYFFVGVIQCSVVDVHRP